MGRENGSESYFMDYDTEDLIPGDNDRPLPGTRGTPSAPDNLCRIPDSGGEAPVTSQPSTSV